MNDTDLPAEVKANLALSDLKRRERLLAIIRGRPPWMSYSLGGVWVVCLACMVNTEKADNAVLLALALLFTIADTHVACSRRMDALVELIGEENLRKPKTDSKEQNA